MIFIKPEEKNLHQEVFPFFKLHYLEIQMWIFVPEKSLKLCFFFSVVCVCVCVLSVLVTIF